MVWGEVLALDRSVTDIFLGPHVEVYEDKNGTLNLTELIDKENAFGWFMPESDILNFGFSDSVMWLKLKVRNDDPKPLSRLFEIAYPILDYIQVFFIRDNTVLESYLLGDKFPFPARMVKHRNYLIPFELGPSESMEIIFRIRSTSSLQIPLNLMTVRSFIEKNQIRTLGFGIYYGVMLAMVLYNLFVFISVKEAAYLYYVFYVISMALLLSCLNGFSFQYLWPESILWNNQSIAVSIGSVVLFALLFTRKFLELPGNKPRMNQVSIYMVIFFCVQLLLCYILPYKAVIHLVIFTSVVMIFFSLFAGILRWIDGYSSARYYTISWLLMLFGGVILALNKLALIPRNTLTENTLQYGSAIEVILLSFALADRLSTEKISRYGAQLAALRNEKLVHQAQDKALKLEKEARLAQEEALDIQKRANENLENNVLLRTRELEIANLRLRELSTTDSLTGLKNRRYFNEIYYKEYNRSIRDKTPLSCLIMDIDHFKRINDNFGHLVGDECLKEIAHAIEIQLHRSNDFLARYGGEEFCALLTSTGVEGAMQVAENIRACVEGIVFKVRGQNVNLTISIGVASEIPDHKKNAEALLNQADSALYQAKSTGRNQVTFYGSDEGNIISLSGLNTPGNMNEN
ncbi:MAG: sensor domain-containing diguanylate cyclase [Proteobacteria bacterium]|nr:sensor domain-containing diguanylate cyclase [Pseudomonadota bacterium]